MRVVKMQPEKKRASRSFLQPRDGVRYALPGATVHQTGIFLLEGFRRKCIIVKVEATCQSPTTVENERADHRSGGVTRLLKGLGDRAKLLCQRLPGEILHAVLKRISAGQNHRMRRPGQGNLRDCPLKHDTVMRQRIEGRRLDHLRSIASHVIGAQSIDGDQYDAWMFSVRTCRIGSCHADWLAPGAVCVFAGTGLAATACAHAVCPPDRTMTTANKEADQVEKRPNMRLFRRQLLRAPRLLVCLRRESLGGQRLR